MAGQLPPGADDEGDDAPQRPRWLGWALVVFMLLVALGVFNIGCHGLVRHYVGPSFQQIAGRYRGREDAADYLARKIREGGAGEWGRAIMPRHPHIDTAQSLQMAAWLLSLPSPEPGKS